MPAPIRDEVEAALDETLRSVARRNELIIAYARALLWCALVPADLLLTALGRPFRAHALAFEGAFAVLSSLFAAAVRRGWYRPWAAHLAPIYDAASYTAALLVWEGAFGPGFLAREGMLTIVALVAAFLGFAGALRLSWLDVVISAAAGVAMYCVAALRVRISVDAIVGQVVVLLGIVLVGVRMAGLVRHAARMELARAALRRFLPRGVVEGAHGDPLELVTSARQLTATVLVTDLRGFTAWSERRSPAEVLGFLNEIQSALARVVDEHGGTVDKFLGDGMLAVFGALQAQPDHARQAIRAARAMLDAAAALSVEIGVGIQTGPIVVGALGGGSRLELTILGDTVNVASRLEALTKELGVQVVLGEATALAAGEAASALRELGTSEIRGRRGCIRVFTTTPTGA